MDLDYSDLNRILGVNQSLGNHKEVECVLQILNIHAEEINETIDDERFYCQITWDSLLCWPKTIAGTLAVLPCFEEFNGIKYDTSENATRYCHSNGTWDNYTDYTACRDVRPTLTEPGIETTTTIYFAGYSISLIALSIAVCIFLYYKELRCLRNSIHTNLMTTYILADFMWILTTVLQVSIHADSWACAFLIILHYFHLTNFFWMFVEGLYLYILVVETFTSREDIKLRVYVAIGWGVPLTIVIIWAVAKSLVPISNGSHMHSELSSIGNCPWMISHLYDWIYQAPAIGILATNLMFLIMIMWVLITKLRSANNLETQQYRKAAKALLVLIPLLGITYILVIAGPTQGVYANVFSYTRAILLSTQGFTVALFYCFLNTEVQNTVRHHWDRWKTTRSLAKRRYQYSRHSREWSPRSHTESVRFTNHCQKRTSTASDLTMSTIVGSNNHGYKISCDNVLGGDGVLPCGRESFMTTDFKIPKTV